MIFSFSNNCQGKYLPGSFFLNGAISECAKIFFLLIFYLFFILRINFFKEDIILEENLLFLPFGL